MNFQRTFRYWYLRFLRLRSAPKEIARGLAIGVFIGFWPIIPFQTVVAVFLAMIFKGNKLAAFIGTNVSNPVTTPFLYYVFYLIGKNFWPVQTSFDLNHLGLKEIINTSWDVFIAMFIGGNILGIPSTILSYFLGLKAVLAFQNKRKKNKRGN